jgi:hypothetical protein
MEGTMDSDGAIRDIGERNSDDGEKEVIDNESFMVGKEEWERESDVNRMF